MLRVPLNFFLQSLWYQASDTLKYHLLEYNSYLLTDLSSEHVFEEVLACRQVYISDLPFSRDTPLTIEWNVFRPVPI